MLSPQQKRKNATSFPSSPTHTLNPLMTILHSNKSSVIQRTLQSRKLFHKINKVNTIITDEKIKWNTPANVTNFQGNHEKFLQLINKNQAPLQINPRIRMRKTIENLMKMNNIETPKSVYSKKNKKKKSTLSQSNRSEKNNETFENFKAIKRSIKQISQISKYFDKVYKIDKKQKYLKIDTLNYWKNIETTPTKKQELLEIYNKVHKDEKFTFSTYQREYEEKWLNILKTAEEKDKKTILFLINGGHHEENEEELIKNFDPSKIIQKIEYKFEQEEKKKQKNQIIFMPQITSPSEKKTPISTEHHFKTERQVSEASSKQNFTKIERKTERNKEVSSYQELNPINPKKKPNFVSSFEQIPEVTSSVKAIKSQTALKMFLNENLKAKTEGKTHEKTTPPPLSIKRSKFSVENEKGFPQQQQISPKEKNQLHINKANKISCHSKKHHHNEFQECFCKHAHNVQIYKMKNSHKSIFKIPSILPSARKTFMAIRRASNMDHFQVQGPRIDFKVLKRFNEENEEEKIFLQTLKTNIDESYYENQNNSQQKNDFILERYSIIIFNLKYFGK